MSLAPVTEGRRRAGTRTRPWRGAVLNVTSALGATCLLAALAGVLFGISPLVVLSGSMSPTIQTGSLVLARTVAAEDLRIGDVVSVEGPTGTRVMHRIESIGTTGGHAVLSLKGDANKAVDAQVYPVEHAQRVFAHIPRAGFVAAWLAGATGRATAAVLVALALLAALLGGTAKRPVRAPEADAAGGRHRSRPARRAGPGALVVALVGAVGGMHVLAPAAAEAAWSDSAAASTGLTAGTVQTTQLSCEDGLLTKVRLTWGAVTGATSYTVHYGTGGAQSYTTPFLTYDVPSSLAGEAWVVVNRSFGSPATVSWSSAASNSFTYMNVSVQLGGVVSQCTAG